MCEREGWCRAEFNSNKSHILHLAPSLVVEVGSVGVLSVVGGLDVDFGIVGVVRVEFNFAHHGRTVLSVDLESESPEHALPDHACLRVLNSQVVLIIDCLRANSKVSIGDIEPKADDDETREDRKYLEPTLRVDRVEREV